MSNWHLTISLLTILDIVLASYFRVDAALKGHLFELVLFGKFSSMSKAYCYWNTLKLNYSRAKKIKKYTITMCNTTTT